MCRRAGLADAAFKVRDRDQFRRLVFGTVGQIILGLCSLSPKMRAQPQHLIQGKPFGTAIGFRQALGQAGVLFQDTPEMRLGDGDQIAGDFPCREKAQCFATIFIHSPAGQICPPACTGRRNCSKPAGVCSGLQLCKRSIWIDIEIGGEP